MGELLREWLPIIISLVALVFSIFTFRSQQKATVEARNREYLQTFLLPLQATLNANLRIHQELTSDTELKKLEYAPDYMQQALNNNLPVDDPRRITWRIRIERMMDENNKAIKLIDQHIGKVTSPDLSRALLDFKNHSQEWEDMWNAVLDPDPNLVSHFTGTGRLLSKPYPDDLDGLLNQEIGAFKQLSGH